MAAIDLNQLESAAKLIVAPRLTKLLSCPALIARSKVAEWRARRGGSTVELVGKTFWGADFYAAIPESVSTTIYRYGIFEEELTRAFVLLLDKGMTFFDVGSHFGYFSLLASALVGETGKVHAFDPTPSTYAMLRKNTSGVANITTSNVAASSTDGEMTFNDFGLAHSAFNSLGAAKMNVGGLRAEVIRVKAITMDGYCRDRNVWPDVMKVDAEGAELDILKGMPELLERRKTTITLEMGDVGETAGSGQSRRVYDFIAARGYKAFEMAGTRMVPHEPLVDYPYTNIIFKPA